MATSADAAFPFDGQETYESEWRAMFGGWLPSGPVITGLGVADWDVLKPSAGSGREVLVEPGAVRVLGHYGRWNSQEALSIATNTSGQTRVDAVVARLDATGNDVELDVVQGTPGAGLPALTQTDSIYEVLLGSSTIVDGGSSVTVADLRRCVGYSEGTYTPVVRNGATTGTLSSDWRARFIRRDAFVHVEAFLTFSSLGGSGAFTMSLPTPATGIGGSNAVHHMPVGQLIRINAMATQYQGLAVVAGTATDRVHFLDVDDTYNSPPYVSDMNTGWNLRVALSYEAAN